MKAAEKHKGSVEVEQMRSEVVYHFPCPIYLMERPDFLEAVTTVSEESLEVSRRGQLLDELYPVMMSDNYFGDERVKEFVEFVGMSAWNILNEQGYAMQDKAVTFMEMWTQEHHKHSSMDQHVHGFGSQITGFYFLDTPENCSKVVFHDPRAGKVQVDLPEQDVNNATAASRMINFIPRPGMLLLANAWLAHSFTKHTADTPIKFVHFNLGVQQVDQSCPMPAAEVV